MLKKNLLTAASAVVFQLEGMMPAQSFLVLSVVAESDCPISIREILGGVRSKIGDQMTPHAIQNVLKRAVRDRRLRIVKEDSNPREYQITKRGLADLNSAIVAFSTLTEVGRTALHKLDAIPETHAEHTNDTEKVVTLSSAR